MWLIPCLWLLDREEGMGCSTSLLSHVSPSQCPQLPSPELLQAGLHCDTRTHLGWMRSLQGPSVYGVSFWWGPLCPQLLPLCLCCLPWKVWNADSGQSKGFVGFLVWLILKCGIQQRDHCLQAQAWLKYTGASATIPADGGDGTQLSAPKPL